MSDNKVTSGSQIGHKYITHVPQVSNNKTTNVSNMIIVIQKWRTLFVEYFPNTFEMFHTFLSNILRST